MQRCIRMILLLLALNWGCATSVEDTLNSEASLGSDASADYTIDESRTFATVTDPHEPVDTIYDEGDHIILLKVQSYSLNDSALINSKRDTIENHVVIREAYSHNANIDFKLIDGDSTWRFSLNKMAFADVLGRDLVMASNAPKIDIRCIDPKRSHVILGASFCFPGTAACNDGFALIDYRKSELKFIAEHGGVDCGSPIEVVKDKILTCSGLFDMEGNKILELKDYIVLAEVIENKSVMIMEARYNEKGLNSPTGAQENVEERDTISENVTVYDLNGQPNYSFAYQGWNDEEEYSAPMVRLKASKRLYLFDFHRKKFYIPQSNKVREYNLQVLNYKPAGYREYRVYNNGRKETVLVNDSSFNAYWKR